MAEGARLSAADYLDRFFEEIRAEARGNPAFAARLVRALGGEITFAERDKIVIAAPLEIAAAGGQAALRDTFGTLDAAGLRKVLRTANLASSVDVRGRTAEELLDLLVRRATAKMDERMG